MSCGSEEQYGCDPVPDLTQDRWPSQTFLAHTRKTIFLIASSLRCPRLTPTRSASQFSISPLRPER